MGKQRRPQPKYLAKKLKAIREELGIGQLEMSKQLGKLGPTVRGGQRFPNLSAESANRTC
jgi:hypothetical protein